MPYIPPRFKSVVGPSPTSAQLVDRVLGLDTVEAPPATVAPEPAKVVATPTPRTEPTPRARNFLGGEKRVSIQKWTVPPSAIAKHLGID